MRCIVFTLTLVLSHQGRGEYGCVVLLYAGPVDTGFKAQYPQGGGDVDRRF